MLPEIHEYHPRSLSPTLRHYFLGEVAVLIEVERITPEIIRVSLYLRSLSNDSSITGDPFKVRDSFRSPALVTRLGSKIRQVHRPVNGVLRVSYKLLVREDRIRPKKLKTLV